MKKILVVCICLLMLLSAVACRKNDAEEAPTTTQASKTEPTEMAPAEEALAYTFISKEERLSWKNNIISVLSAENVYEDIEFGCLGAALMDLNFDNTPELIVVGAGGSMGNVCVVVFDLETKEELCVLGDTPHYKDWDNIYLCVRRNNEGKYLIINEGSLRVGLEWYIITSSLNDQYKFYTLFEEVKSSDDNIRYYCDGDEVDKTKFEQKKNQFINDYKEITKTQVKIVYWKNIDAKTKSEAVSEMADTLVNSDQQFIDFNK